MLKILNFIKVHFSIMSISLKTKIRIVQLMSQNPSPKVVWRQFRKEGWEDRPTEKSIKRIYDKFLETGSVTDKKSTGRPKSSSEKTMEIIDEMIFQNPKLTISEVSARIRLPRSTSGRIMKDMGLKSYVIQTHQQLDVEDYDMRLDFAQTFMPILRQCIDNGTVRIGPSDEATFHTSGRVHKWNCRIWGYQKPREVHEYKRGSSKINVWCMMTSKTVIGPYFFENQTVDSQKYLDMLKNFLYPELQKKRVVRGFWFMHDGAPIHNSKIVKEFLNKKFPGRWIGRGGSIPWPARSPDLTPLDFFLWGFVKQKVYKQKIQNVDHLKQLIKEAVDSITPEMCEATFSNWLKRLECIEETQGRHIEQFF